MRVVLNVSTLRSDIKQDIHASLNGLRVQLGLVAVTLRTNIAALGSPAILPQARPVLSGQDLRRMAAATYGDADKWTLIADKNGMVFPWVAWPDASGNYPTSALIPGTVAQLGTMVQGPSLAPGGILVPDPIGTDLDPNGTVDANGHLALVGGLVNLEAALTRRLMTPRGYLPQHPDYGSLLSTFMGGDFDVATLLAIRADVSRTLKQDPRVVSVQSVSLNASGAAGSVVVSASIQTVLGSLTLSTPALTS
jgi:phage baseplate assembly protein W